MTPESLQSVSLSPQGPQSWPCRERGLFMATIGRVLFTRIDEHLDPQSFERFLIELERSIEMRTPGQRIGIIYDVPDIGLNDAVRRRRVADILREREITLGSTTAGFALASSSRIVRGMLEAIFWIAPPPYPHTTVEGVREGLEFLSQFLPDVDPEAYAFEYQRLLARHGVVTSGPAIGALAAPDPPPYGRS